MFGFKRRDKIDKEQLELIKNAQARIKQKKTLYYHFIFFILGAICLFISNKFIGIGQQYTFLENDWYIYAIMLWLIILGFHVFKVFIISPFMGKSWEEKQILKLMNLQQQRIASLKESLLKEESQMAKEQLKKDNIKLKNLTIIVAADSNNAIGKDNSLIWHLSNDLKRFKSLTSGHHIIMGRKTFESFPKPLPNRTHIVITRQENYKVPEGVKIAKSIEDAINLISNDSQPFIIGGGEIYKLAIPYSQKIELTRVHHAFEGADTFFVPIDEASWKLEAKNDHFKDEHHNYDYSFLTYEKI